MVSHMSIMTPPRSVMSAKFHVNSILQKLSAQKRVEAVVRAARLGLIEL